MCFKFITEICFRRVEWTKKLESVVMENVDENVKLDCGSDTFPIIQNYICDLLRKGLSERVSLITPKCLSHDDLCWSITGKFKKQNPLKKPMIFGLKLNPDHAFNSVDKGPEANMPGAEQFRYSFHKSFDIIFVKNIKFI